MTKLKMSGRLQRQTNFLFEFLSKYFRHWKLMFDIWSAQHISNRVLTPFLSIILQKHSFNTLRPEQNGPHHDDVIKWNHFPRYWPFVRGLHRSRWIPRTKASDAELWCFLRLNKRLGKQLWGWWFETPPWSLWRHCNDYIFKNDFPILNFYSNFRPRSLFLWFKLIRSVWIRRQVFIWSNEPVPRRIYTSYNLDMFTGYWLTKSRRSYQWVIWGHPRQIDQETACTTYWYLGPLFGNMV